MPKFNLQKVAWLLMVGATLASAAATAACSSAGEGQVDNSWTTGTGGGSSCATPSSGCACSIEGKTAACGSVLSHEGNHVECSEGTMSCTNGVWGTCIGETTHTMTLGPTGDLHIQGLSPTPGVCAGDPCDPYCQSYTDTPMGFDAGSPGIAVTDGGVSLVGIVTKSTACTGFTVSPTTETLTVTQIPASGSIVYTGSPSASPFTYTDALLPASCYTGAPPTVWTLDNPSIASISSTGTVQLVSPVATSFHVTAYSGGWSNAAAPALVNVVVNAVDTSSAPTGYTNSSFTGSPMVADGITVLYPYNGTVLPLGLVAPTVQWTGANPFTISAIAASGSSSSLTTSTAHGLATGQTVTITGATGNTAINGTFTVTVTSSTQFTIPVAVSGTYTAGSGVGWQAANAIRLQLRYPAGSGSLFTWSGILPENQTLPTPPAPGVALPGLPRATPPQNVWNAFAQTAIGQTADIVVQRIVNGVLLKPNTPVNITFATGQLKGNVYYQSYGTNLVHNYSPTYLGASFGGATLAIQPGATTPTVVAGTSSQCVVCHSVSASGANLLTQNGGNYLQTFDYNLSTLAETTMSPANAVFAWAGLAYNGSYLFSNSGGLYDATSANSALYTVPGGTAIAVTGLPAIQATSPSFSADNAHVAFNFYGGSAKNAAGTTLTGDTASLASIDYAASATTFSNFQVLATPGAGTVGAGTGTVTVTHNSATITFSTAQTFAIGTSLVFGSQAGTVYKLSANISASTTATLTAAYSGTTTAGAAWAYTGNIYYPSYLPSNNQLVWEFQTINNGRGGELNDAETRSQCDTKGPVACQNDGTHAELWWTDVTTQKSAKLTNLNGGSYLPPHAAALLPNGDNQLNYEPTVLPQNTGGYSWVVFTSRRMYGNTATVNPFWSDPRFQDLSAQPTPKKLWVSAINPSAAAGTDPSYPAFYLPGQELLAGNSRGYWVLSQCEAAGAPTAANLCTSNLDCCPAASGGSPVVCALDTPPATTAHCTSSPSTSCSANGGACSTSSQCCSFPSSVCAQNVCSPVQTITYAPSTFTVVYNGKSCPVGNNVSWVDVGLEALLPSSNGSNSSISIGAQVSNTSAGFTPTIPVNVGTFQGPPANQSATWTNFPLSPALTSISTTAETEPYLQVTFALSPSTDKSVTPTITDWRVRFDCVPTQ